MRDFELWVSNSKLIILLKDLFDALLLSISFQMIAYIVSIIIIIINKQLYAKIKLHVCTYVCMYVCMNVTGGDHHEIVMSLLKTSDSMRLK